MQELRPLIVNLQIDRLPTPPALQRREDALARMAVGEDAAVDTADVPADRFLNLLALGGLELTGSGHRVVLGRIGFDFHGRQVVSVP